MRCHGDIDGWDWTSAAELQCARLTVHTGRHEIATRRIVQGTGFQPAVPFTAANQASIPTFQSRKIYKSISGISTSGFSKFFQINANTSHTLSLVVLHCCRMINVKKTWQFKGCLLPCECVILANTCRNTYAISHGVIWYLAYTHSVRFQTFTIGKVCFLQVNLSINDLAILLV